MPYERPRFTHETEYSIGEKVLSLQHQLVLLRESLVRTVVNPTFYPDLFRALRVLVVDQGRGRLGEMADRVGMRYMVQSRSAVKIEPREASPHEARGQRLAFPRHGLDNLLLPNLHSRWLVLREIGPGTDTEPILVDFWDYLEQDVIAFKKEFGAEITREALIRETCDTRDVAHSANCYPTFLRLTNALGKTGPYFLEVAQELAYEVLTFGRQVVAKCTENYANQISTALPYVLPIPQIECTICHRVLGLDELRCPGCGAGLLPPRVYSPREQLSSMFFFGGLLNKPTGTVAMRIDTSALTYDGVAEYTLVNLVEGDSRLLLKRTGDRKLVWQVDRDLVTLTASWDLTELAVVKSVTLFLAWSPEEASIICDCRRGGLWKARSDGSFSKLEDQESAVPA